jgi:predicted DNA-binding transcriptional regulator AlpA
MTTAELLASASRKALRAGNAGKQAQQQQQRPKQKPPARYAKPDSKPPPRPRDRPVARSDTSSEDADADPFSAGGYRYKDLLDARIVSNRTDLSRKQREHGFPLPIKTGVKQAWFVKSEVHAWLRKRAALRDKPEHNTTDENA